MQIVRRAASQFALDHGQGREGALHAEPQEAQRHQRHRHQRQHAAAQDLVGQGFARASVSATRTVTQPACWLADTSLPTVATRTGSS